MRIEVAASRRCGIGPDISGEVSNEMLIKAEHPC